MIKAFPVPICSDKLTWLPGEFSTRLMLGIESPTLTRERAELWKDARERDTFTSERLNMFIDDVWGMLEGN